MKLKKDNMFDCPSCGNPLFRSKKQQVRCIYCKQLVDVPQNANKRKAKG